MSTSSARRARAWLAENAERLTSGGVVNRMQSREHRIAIYDAGFGGITWPVEYGGLGLTGAHQEAFTEEAANYPDLVVGDLVTAGICAPTLLDFGSEEQKRRYIPHMLRGDEVWTQLLSEPGAGSDLAGLQTKAVLDGDEWVVNGQKVWTSGAMASEFAILIARTNPDVPKHQGLSMFIVDLKAPGSHHPPAEADDGQRRVQRGLPRRRAPPRRLPRRCQRRRLARAPAHADARAHGDRRGNERLAAWAATCSPRSATWRERRRRPERGRPRRAPRRLREGAAA